jgi:hypothetical protein
VTAWRRTLAAAVLVGATVGVVAGSLAGSTASASGLRVAGGQLQAGAVVVRGCQSTGLTASFAFAYDPTTTVFRTASVTLGGVAAACHGKSVRVTLASAAGVALAEVTGTTALAASTTFTVGPGVTASDVARVAVVISG